MMAALNVSGNPSSVHAEGRAARRLIESARCQVAELLGAEPRCVVFTSGGTEANMLALTPAMSRPGHGDNCDRLLVSAIEHPSVRSGGRFARGRTEEVPVAESGVVNLDALAQRLRELAGAGTGRPLVSIMLANNETGALQPIAAAAKIVHGAGGLLHVDAVQGPGRVAFSIGSLGADLMTLSGHKFGGPKGIGALVRREEALRVTGPLLRGGGQERGWRAGTENVAAIAGFGAAAAAARANFVREVTTMRELRDRFEQRLRLVSSNLIIFGASVERLPNTILFAVPGIKAATAVIALDLSGVAVSSGAACSSGKVQSSHVLAAMGIKRELAGGAIRVSIGPQTTESDLDCLLNAWQKFTGSLNKGVGGLAA
jgi:cysteine desulfurase